MLEATDFDRIRIKGYVVHGEMAYQAWINGFQLGEVRSTSTTRRRAASKLTLEEIYAWPFSTSRRCASLRLPPRVREVPPSRYR